MSEKYNITTGWIRVDSSEEDVVCIPLDDMIRFDIKPRHKYEGERDPGKDIITIVCPICNGEWSISNFGVLAVGPAEMICKKCKRKGKEMLSYGEKHSSELWDLVNKIEEKRVKFFNTNIYSVNVCLLGKKQMNILYGLDKEVTKILGLDIIKVDKTDYLAVGLI